MPFHLPPTTFPTLPEKLPKIPKSIFPISLKVYGVNTKNNLDLVRRRTLFSLAQNKCNWSYSTDYQIRILCFSLLQPAVFLAKKHEKEKENVNTLLLQEKAK